MEVKVSKMCTNCTNAGVIEELEAREAAAEKAGTLVVEGSLECLGPRAYNIKGQPYERCRLTFTPPEISDPVIAEEISRIAPDPRPRPV